jgi:Na+/phosphate symporter
LETLDLIKLLFDGSTTALMAFMFYKFMELMRDVRKDDSEREKDDTALQSGFVNVIQALVSQAQASTAALQTVHQDLQAVHKNIEDARTKMGSVTERREAQLVQLQASIDRLPENVKAALLSDFENVGNLIASLNQGVLTLNEDVRKAFAEYAKMGAKLQAVLEPSSGADAPPSTAERAEETPSAGETPSDLKKPEEK